MKTGVKVQIGRVLAAAILLCGVAAARAGDPDKGGKLEHEECYDLFHPVPEDKLREFSPDRPSLFTSPQTIDAGHVQVELSFVEYTYDRHNPERAHVDVDQWNPGPVDLRIGLTQRAELDLIYDGYINVRTRDRDAGTTHTQSGFGDLTLLFKYNLFGNDGGKVAFGLLPFLKLPTNTAGLGNKYVEGGLLLPLTIELPANFELGVSTEFDAIRNDSNTRYEAAFTNILFLGYNFLDKKFQVYGEFYSQVNQGPDSQVTATVNGGLVYFIGKNAEIDLGCNFGVTRAAPDFNPFAGMSVRFLSRAARMDAPPSEFEMASLWQRVLARGVDTALCFVLLILPAQLLTSQSGLIGITSVIVLFVLALAYRFFADGVFDGAALGKRIVGIYVVDAATRQSCSIGQCLARTSVFIIPFVSLIELVVLAIDRRERWGDRLAETYVLRRHPKSAPVHVPSKPFNLDKLGDTLAKLKEPNDRTD